MKKISVSYLLIFFLCIYLQSFLKVSGAVGNNSMLQHINNAVNNKTYRIVYFLTESKSMPVASFLKERQEQAKHLTHVIYFPSSINIDENENITLSSAQTADWQSLKVAGKEDGFKPMFCFHRNMDIIRTTLQDENLRASLIQHILTLQQTLNGAGIDFDIEYPSSAKDTKLIGIFLTQLRKAIGNKILLTADVGPKSFTRSPLGHLEGNVLNNCLNWVNLMSYGKGENNGLQMMYNIVKEYRHKQVDANKIVIGLPFYAKAYYTNEAGKKTPFIPSYEYLVQNILSDDMSTDSLVFNRPGANPNYLLFNSPRTIETKAKFAKSYGGVMAWHWRDDVTNKHSLTNAILRGRNE